MDKDSKLIELSCKEVLMDIVKESETLNEKLSFFQKTLLYDKIREMKYEDVISVLFNDGKQITTEQKREFESKTKKIAKYGTAATLGTYGIRKAHQVGQSIKMAKNLNPKAVAAIKSNPKSFKNVKNSLGTIKDTAKNLRRAPGGIKKISRGKAAIAAVAGLFLYRKLTDPCVRKNIGNKQAQNACKAAAIKKVTERIRMDMGKCANASADPAKCKAKLSKELSKWNAKYQSYLIQLNKNR